MSRCTARFILVIEKDAIFQRLTEDRLAERVPCVLVTAKGQPDLATRCVGGRPWAACVLLVASKPALMCKDSG